MRITTLFALLGVASAIKMADDSKYETVEGESEPYVPECDYVLSEDGKECLLKETKCIASHDAPVLEKCPARVTSEESMRLGWTYSLDKDGNKVWKGTY